MAIRIHDIHPHIISDDATRYPPSPLGGKASDWSNAHHITIDDMIAAMDAAGVASSALVQAASYYGYNNGYVAEAVARHPDRFTAVGTIDVLAHDAVAVMEGWIARGITGLRLYTGGSKLKFDFSWLDDARSFPVWERAGALGMPICVQARMPAFPTIEAMARRFPQTCIIIDHLARADISDGAPYLAAKPLFDLAAFPNIFLKITPRSFDLAATGTASPETFFPQLVEAFGADRCAFGSNYPASEGSLAQIVARAKENFAALKPADRDMILSGTAERLYPALA